MENIILFCKEIADMDVIGKAVEFLIPFVILIITLHDERKQNAKYKRQEIKLEYLKECMDWLKELMFLAYIVSDKASNYICSCNAERIEEIRKEFNTEANTMMEKCLIGVTTYSSINKALCIEFNLEEIRILTGKFIREMREICENGVADQEEFQINNSTQIFQKKIKEKILWIGEKISALLI